MTKKESFASHFCNAFDWRWVGYHFG